MSARRHPPLRGLYALTPDDTDDLTTQVTAALAGGARLVQYRDKRAADRVMRERARALLAICHAAGVPLIINDDIALAREIGAGGVHLGRDDPSPAAARAVLGPQAIIGVSCYASVERAREAARDGADYVAFGSFHASATKPQASSCDIAILRAAAAEIALPIVAIGGITLDNAGELLGAGADLLAVISAVFGAADACAAARAFSDLIEREPSRAD